MKTLITAPLLVISSAFAGDITNFGATMPNGDDYSTPIPSVLVNILLFLRNMALYA